MLRANDQHEPALTMLLGPVAAAPHGLTPKQEANYFNTRLYWERQ